MAYLFLVRSVAVIAASTILLAATPTPVPVRVALNDLVGMWVTVSGDCSQGQHLLDANGKYKVWCFDSISEGEWSLRGGNKIIVKHDPKTSDEEIITVVRVERYSDHTAIGVRYQNGTREKWVK
jgi:hypothetical protein